MSDYLYAGTTDILTGFESFLQTKFNISTLESGGFNIMGTFLTQAKSVTGKLFYTAWLTDPVFAFHDSSASPIVKIRTYTTFVLSTRP